MRFYEGHTLSSTSDKHSFFTKERLVLPDKILKKTPELAKAKLTIQVRYYKDECSAIVSLYADSACLSSCVLSTVEYNCSAVMIANLYCNLYFHKGLGWFLLDLVEQWAEYAGYTLLIGNTAGTDQNRLIPKFKEKGWVESNINYVNTRTRNKNIWLYKVIAEAEEEGPEEDDDEYYEEENSDEDEEF